MQVGSTHRLRRRGRLAVTLAVAVACLGLGAYALSAVGGAPGGAPRAGSGGTVGASHRAQHRGGAGSATGALGTVPPGAATTTTAPPATTTTGPGTLPQTTTLPSGSGPQFQAEMADLWNGVVTGTVRPAMGAFFPEGAYAQLKAISDPTADYQNRLVADYAADLRAARALLGADPSSATFVSVNVPTSYAHWVPPGVCYNSIGYYEVPNARVVYRLGGQVKSFGIASMISWRGQWYVVHLGSILRPTTTHTGAVDAPATGPGTSAYSSTC